MNYLIVDLNIKLDGHKLGFIQNLIDYVSKIGIENNYWFYVNSSTEFEIVEPNNPNIKVLYTTEQEQKTINSNSRFLKKAEAEWKCINEKSVSLKIEKLILMELDPYQLEIGRRSTDFEISGIWFRPYHRMQQEESGLKGIIKYKIYKTQKKLTIKWALRNKNLKNVFVLNDERLPGLRYNNTFKYLADPYMPYQLKSDFDLRKKYQIPEGQTIILQFGFIDERKNTENIMVAIESLDDELVEKITLLVIGKFAGGYKVKFESLLNENMTLRVILVDEFIPNNEMEATFAQSDIIARMNLHFYGSSGVVGIAAKHNKPVLVSSYGVMAEEVEKYKLGKIAHPENIYEIKDALETILDKNYNINGEKYIQNHTLEIFTKTLLNLS